MSDDDDESGDKDGDWARAEANSLKKDLARVEKDYLESRKAGMRDKATMQYLGPQPEIFGKKKKKKKAKESKLIKRIDPEMLKALANAPEPSDAAPRPATKPLPSTAEILRMAHSMDPASSHVESVAEDIGENEEFEENDPVDSDEAFDSQDTAAVRYQHSEQDYEPESMEALEHSVAEENNSEPAEETCAGSESYSESADESYVESTDKSYGGSAAGSYSEPAENVNSTEFVNGASADEFEEVNEQVAGAMVSHAVSDHASSPGAHDYASSHAADPFFTDSYSDETDEEQGASMLEDCAVEPTDALAEPIDGPAEEITDEYSDSGFVTSGESTFEQPDEDASTSYDLASDDESSADQASANAIDEDEEVLEEEIFLPQSSAADENGEEEEAVTLHLPSDSTEKSMQVVQAEISDKSFASQPTAHVEQKYMNDNDRPSQAQGPKLSKSQSKWPKAKIAERMAARRKSTSEHELPREEVQEGESNAQLSSIQQPPYDPELARQKLLEEKISSGTFTTDDFSKGIFTQWEAAMGATEAAQLSRAEQELLGQVSRASGTNNQAENINPVEARIQDLVEQFRRESQLEQEVNPIKIPGPSEKFLSPSGAATAGDPQGVSQPLSASGSAIHSSVASNANNATGAFNSHGDATSAQGGSVSHDEGAAAVQMLGRFWSGTSPEVSSHALPQKRGGRFWGGSAKPAQSAEHLKSSGERHAPGTSAPHSVTRMKAEELKVESHSVIARSSESKTEIQPNEHASVAEPETEVQAKSEAPGSMSKPAVQAKPEAPGIMPKPVVQAEGEAPGIMPKPVVQAEGEAPGIMPKPAVQAKVEAPGIMPKPAVQAKSEAPGIEPKPAVQAKSEAPGIMPKPAVQAKSEAQGIEPKPAVQAKVEAQGIEPKPAVQAKSEAQGIEPKPAVQAKVEAQGIEPKPAVQAKVEAQGIEPKPAVQAKVEAPGIMPKPVVQAKMEAPGIMPKPVVQAKVEAPGIMPKPVVQAKVEAPNIEPKPAAQAELEAQKVAPKLEPKSSSAVSVRSSAIPPPLPLRGEAAKAPTPEILAPSPHQSFLSPGNRSADPISAAARSVLGVPDAAEQRAPAPKADLPKIVPPKVTPPAVAPSVSSLQQSRAIQPGSAPARKKTTQTRMMGAVEHKEIASASRTQSPPFQVPGPIKMKAAEPKPVENKVDNKDVKVKFAASAKARLGTAGDNPSVDPVMGQSPSAVPDSSAHTARQESKPSVAAPAHTGNAASGPPITAAASLGLNNAIGSRSGKGLSPLAYNPWETPSDSEAGGIHSQAMITPPKDEYDRKHRPGTGAIKKIVSAERVFTYKYPDGSATTVKYNSANVLVEITIDGGKWKRNAAETGGWIFFDEKGRKQDVMDGELDVTDKGDIVATRKDGYAETQFADGTFQIQYPNKRKEIHYPDGTCVLEDARGNRTYRSKAGIETKVAAPEKAAAKPKEVVAGDKPLRPHRMTELNRKLSNILDYKESQKKWQAYEGQTPEDGITWFKNEKGDILKQDARDGSNSIYHPDGSWEHIDRNGKVTLHLGDDWANFE